MKWHTNKPAPRVPDTYLLIRADYSMERSEHLFHVLRFDKHKDTWVINSDSEYYNAQYYDDPERDPVEWLKIEIP